MAKLTYDQIYRNLDGMVAMQVCLSTSLRKQKDEKDTAFVKRIVATYIEAAQPIDCLFCGELAGDGAVSDEAGEVACAICGQAEVEAQRSEGFIPALPNGTRACDDNGERK